MRNCFRQFDTNGDGRIDRKELDAVFQQLGEHVTQEQLDRIIQHASHNTSSDSIDYEQFIELAFGKHD